MKKIIGVVLLAAAGIGAVEAAPIVTHPAQSVQQLTASPGAWASYGGLMKDGNNLYYGFSDKVRSYDLVSNSGSDYATIGFYSDTTAFAKVGSSIHMAVTTSFNAPYPSNMGTVDPANGFQPLVSSGTQVNDATYAIYDAASYGGRYYFVANDGTITNAAPLGGNTAGSSIYRYDAGAPGGLVEIADVGGVSGGLTFDADGNLYYASQNGGEGVLKFDAADVALGGLTAGDGTTVVNITASSLGFLSNGELVATTGFGQEMASYDVSTGLKTHDIAETSGLDYMGKFVVGGDDTIYVTSTDWGVGDAELSAIAIPEPSSVAFMLIGFGGMAWFRRRRRFFLQR